MSREILTVGAFATQSRKLLERSFPDVWIRGELSRVTDAASGHAYFTLKDKDAAISCAFFKGNRRASPTQPEDGLEVVVRGRATVYEKNGRFQVVVNYMELAGLGDLQKAFDELKKKLLGEGLFDEARKQALPALPGRVALITSPTGAAVQDMISTFQRRFKRIALRVYPVRVQGDEAVREIVDAIALANTRRDCDVIIVSRGGGSLEDLHAFNDEAVARAIAASELPVVSGVGHEIDFSIADFVADARAPTPTAAAELLSPDGDEILAQFRGWSGHLQDVMARVLQQHAQHLDFLERRLVHPRRRVEELRQRLTGIAARQKGAARSRLARLALAVAELEQQLAANAPATRLATVDERHRALRQRMVRAALQSLQGHRNAVDTLAQRAQSLGPAATLERGYAIVSTADGNIVTDAADHKPGETLTARLARGELDVTVNAARGKQ